MGFGQKAYSHAAWIEIDCAIFRDNLALIRRCIGPNVRICLPVKANAYGHGLEEIALAAESSVDYFGVSCLQEGMHLREAGIVKPILMFGAIDADQMVDAIVSDITLTLSSIYKADKAIEAAALAGKRAKVHVEIETGMQRTGMRVDTAMGLIDRALTSDALELVGIYSHCATADRSNDAYTHEQLKRFVDFIQPIKERYPDVVCHIANSGALLHYPESYLDMVRPGLLAFGYFGTALDHPILSGLKPFFALKSRVTFFKVVAANSGIGYGHCYTTTQATRIVTIPIGYGDGYRRALSNRAQVIIRGKRYPIVGMICMDQLMVDVGDDSVYVGDEVVLVGSQGDATISINEIAELCDTIPYEILCGFNDRIVRRYQA